MDYTKKNGVLVPKERLFAPMLASFGGGSIRGFRGLGPFEEPLYEFTSHTFTNAGSTGRFGPSLSECQSAYSGAAFLTSHFNVNYNGHQDWTAPSTGNYTITMAGAEGGTSGTQAPTPGKGGVLTNFVINLNQGDVIRLIVGQKGGTTTYSGGGGGGSFVIKDDVCLLAAAGGQGGGYLSAYPANDASTTLASTSSVSSGGSAGANLGGGGGAGFSGDGSDGGYANSGGHDYFNTATGSFAGGGGDGGSARAEGAFGGGAGAGGGSSANAGGGAGGWQGGDGQNGGTLSDRGNKATSYRASSVTAGTVTATNTGHGYITITGP